MSTKRGLVYSLWGSYFVAQLFFCSGNLLMDESEIFFCVRGTDHPGGIIDFLIAIIPDFLYHF
jgi:hypothetical protein